MTTRTGKGGAKADCPANEPNALSWSATQVVRYSAPLHGSSVATQGQAATGWRIKALKRKAPVTLYVICGP